MKKLVALFFCGVCSAFATNQIREPTQFLSPSSIYVQPGSPMLGTWDFTKATVVGIPGLPVPYVNVKDYGAVADDSTDNTAAFNNAIVAAGPTGTVYIPEGTYKIVGQIELNGGIGVNWPARLIGAGTKLTTLHITSASLSVQTAGTIQAARGAGISDLRFVYDQPDHINNYGPPILFNQYLPTIYVNQHFVSSTGLDAWGTGLHRGGRYERLRFEAAWDGITIVGNITDKPLFGQEIFDDIEMGMLNRGISLDGLTDSCYINRFRAFPYGLTSSMEVAQQLPGHSVGIYAGRADDLRCTNSDFYNGRGLDLHAGADRNGPHANFVNCNFDNFCHIQIGDGAPAVGYAQFTNCHFSNVPRRYAGDTQVTTSYMNVLFTGCLFAITQLTPYNCIETHSDPYGSHVVYFNNCEFTMNTHDASAITGDATLSVKGCHFYRTSGHTYRNPIINVTGGMATIVDNQVAPLTSGSGVFLNLPVDNYHIVSGNSAYGWNINWPISPVMTQGYGNTLKLKSPLGSAGQNSSLAVKQLFIEGGSSNNMKMLSGAGSPEGIVTADPGSLYLNTSGGGNYVKSTGTGNTGWSTTEIYSASTSTVSAGYAADTYLAGSAITVAAGGWKVKGTYHCRFDMTKTAAGTATPIITVRMGTLGTTGDAAIGTLTFAAGTAAIDTGLFDVDVVFRTVGSGTSAVIQMLGKCDHHLAATGLTSTGAAGTGIIAGTSAGFNSTTQTKLGLSFNGGTSFSGTNSLVQAELKQP